MPWKLGTKWSKENAVKHNKKLEGEPELIECWIMRANEIYDKTESDAEAIISANRLIKRVYPKKKKFISVYKRKLKNSEGKNKKEKKQKAFKKTKDTFSKELEEERIIKSFFLKEEKLDKIFSTIRSEINERI